MLKTAILLLSCLISARFGAAQSLGTAAVEEATRYAMVYFAESNQGLGNMWQLHLAVSEDSLKWIPLNQNRPVANATLGDTGLRDPFLLRKQDGTFVVLATDLKGTNWAYQSQYIHVWDSTDLKTFNNYRLLKINSAFPSHNWAPEAFWDPVRQKYAIIFSAVPVDHDCIMVSYTTDFITAEGPLVYFDPGKGVNVIDGDMAHENGINYLYFKNQSTESLVASQSTSLEPGSFKVFGTPAKAGGTEAPTVYKAGDTWYIWGDTYTPNGVFYAWYSKSLASGTWTPLDQKLYTQPLNSKHCGIAAITASEYAGALATWGTPTWNRIKSFNYPGRYWRHQDYTGRIDAYPFDPYTDSLFFVVPGLANASGVSFQSINFPNRYLKPNSTSIIRLDTNDGSATFAADATFYKEAGLASSTWSSFRSHSNPTKYIRHYAYVLRIDAIASDVEKQDATFDVWY
ncbi:endo-1,4-beta-xylanase [Cladochytrium replicatum]|nr:endo-1,4-beta-xylanase [Cladochytrium replicatum]